MISNSIKSYFKIFIWIALILALEACATPGKKFITISRKPDLSTGSGTERIGIAPFQDRRHNMDKRYIGYRILLDNTRETYFIRGMDLSQALTDVLISYYADKGFSPVMTDAWELTPEGARKACTGFRQILTARINRFECRAYKKGPATDMTLDIDLTFFLGLGDRHILKTIPVSLTLEKTLLNFTAEKLQQFIDNSMTEVIHKALNL